MADDRTEEIVKAIKARNSVLLDELFENMISSERANVLGSGHYGSGEFPYEDAPLAKAADNGDLASVEVLLKYKADIEVREDHPSFPSLLTAFTSHPASKRSFSASSTGNDDETLRIL